MIDDDFAVPDDLTELLGPVRDDVTRSDLARSPATGAGSAIAGSPAEKSGVAGGSSRAHLKMGRSVFGRRLSAEQQALRNHARAEEATGKLLDRLVRIGARTLHDRQGLIGHSQLDHILINESGIHLVETVWTSDRNPLRVDTSGEPWIGPVPLRQRVQFLWDSAAELAMRVNGVLGFDHRARVYPVVAVVGEPSRVGVSVTQADLVSLDLIPSWTSRLAAVHDPSDVVALADAVSRICPPYGA